MRKHFLTTLLLSLPFTSIAAIVLDIPTIAGKSKPEVNSILGSPNSCSPSKYGEKCFYTTGESEIVFINGKADWITVEGIDDIAFNSKVLSALGFAEVNPDFSNSYTLRWSSVKGVHEIQYLKAQATLITLISRLLRNNVHNKTLKTQPAGRGCWDKNTMPLRDHSIVFLPFSLRLEVDMKINEALILVDRIRNLPEFFDKVEAAVCGVIHSYYDELYEIEKIEAKIVSEVGFDDERLGSLLQKKVEIHDKFWTNSSSFYKPCSVADTPDHLWESLSGIEVMHNGDDDNPLYIFKAKKLHEDGSTEASVAFILRLIESDIYIEHEFFG